MLPRKPAQSQLIEKVHRDSSPLLSGVDARNGEQRARALVSQVKVSSPQQQNLQAELEVSNDIIKELMSEKMIREQQDAQAIGYLEKHQAFISKSDSELNHLLADTHASIEEINELHSSDNQVLQSFGYLSQLLDVAKNGSAEDAMRLLNKPKKENPTRNQKERAKKKREELEQQLSQIGAIRSTHSLATESLLHALPKGSQHTGTKFSFENTGDVRTLVEKENLQEIGQPLKQEERVKGSLMQKIENIITERGGGGGATKRSTTPLTGRKKKKI